MIEATPRAFPPSVKRLHKLPKCGKCIRREQAIKETLSKLKDLTGLEYAPDPYT